MKPGLAQDTRAIKQVGPEIVDPAQADVGADAVFVRSGIAELESCLSRSLMR